MQLYSIYGCVLTHKYFQFNNGELHIVFSA